MATRTSLGEDSNQKDLKRINTRESGTGLELTSDCSLPPAKKRGMATTGTLAGFDLKNQPWDEYIEMLKQFLF